MNRVIKHKNWEIILVRSSRLQTDAISVRGWLTNTKSGVRYVWSVTSKGRVNFMREYKPPNNIPRYIEDLLLELADDVRDTRTHERRNETANQRDRSGNASQNAARIQRSGASHADERGPRDI